MNDLTTATRDSVFVGPIVECDMSQREEMSDVGVAWGFFSYCELIMVPNADQTPLHQMIGCLFPGNPGSGPYLSWFKRLPYPHYRIPATARFRAIKLGAVKLEEEELLAVANGEVY